MALCFNVRTFFSTVYPFRGFLIRKVQPTRLRLYGEWAVCYLFSMYEFFLFIGGLYSTPVDCNTFLRCIA